MLFQTSLIIGIILITANAVLFCQQWFLVAPPPPPPVSSVPSSNNPSASRDALLFSILGLEAKVKEMNTLGELMENSIESLKMTPPISPVAVVAPSSSSSAGNVPKSKESEGLQKIMSHILTLPASKSIHTSWLGSIPQRPSMADKLVVGKYLVKEQVKDSLTYRGQDPNRFYAVFDPVVSCRTLTPIGNYDRSLTTSKICDAYKLTEANLGHKCSMLVFGSRQDARDWKKSSNLKVHPFLKDVLHRMDCDMTVILQDSFDLVEPIKGLTIVNIQPISDLLLSDVIQKTRLTRVDVLKIDLDEENVALAKKWIAHSGSVLEQLKVKMIDIHFHGINFSGHQMTILSAITEHLMELGYYMYSRDSPQSPTVGQFFFAHSDFLLEDY